MTSIVHNKTYRTPYLRRKRHSLLVQAGEWLLTIPLTARQKVGLLILAVCAFCVGLVFSVTMHARIASEQAVRTQAEQQYLALDNQHILLLSTRANLGSRERISKMAAARFQLFEPTKDQVQHP